MIAIALVGAGLLAFPMNMRGAERTMSDTIHLIGLRHI
jgi:hypothetical protein